MKIYWRKLMLYIMIPLVIGIISYLTASSNMLIYQALKKPPFALPTGFFPLIWFVLFFLMGISSYMIALSSAPNQKDALQIYGIQLIFNFMWCIVFFSLLNYILAFFIILVLWFCTFKMITSFKKINNQAACLQIPYLFYLTYLIYLNLMICFLN